MAYKVYITPNDESAPTIHAACLAYMNQLEQSVDWLKGIAQEYEGLADLILHPAVRNVDTVESEVEFDTQQNMNEFCAVLEQHNVEFSIIN